MAGMGLGKNLVNRKSGLNKQKEKKYNVPPGARKKGTHYFIVLKSLQGLPTSHHQTGWASPHGRTSRTEQMKGIDALKKQMLGSIFFHLCSWEIFEENLSLS